MSNTLKAVLKLLHKQYNRTKGFDGATYLMFPHTGSSEKPFDKKSNTLIVDPDNMVTLGDTILKKFKKFSLVTLLTVDYTSGDGTRGLEVAELSNEIEAFLLDRAAQKAEKKVKKVKVPKEPAELSVFSFSDSFNREVLFDKTRLTLTTGSVNSFNLESDFWKAFDKWYGKNRKALLKKVKKSKKVGPHGFERVDEDASVTKSSGDVFEDLGVPTPNALKEKTHNLTANDGVYHPPIMQEKNSEPGHVMIGSVELTEEDSANKPTNEKTLHVG